MRRVKLHDLFWENIKAKNLKDFWLVVEPTHLKNMLVKLDHFPKDRGEHKKYLSCHQPDLEATQRLVTVRGDFLFRHRVQWRIVECEIP